MSCRLFHVLAALLMFVSCGPMMVPAELVITLAPRAVTDATPVRVTVTATHGDGSIGQGTVKVTSSAGSLTAGTDLTLDEFGRATTMLVCDPTMESLCSPSVRVVAEWNAGAKGGVVTGEGRVGAMKPPPVVVDPEDNPDGGMSSLKPYVVGRIDANCDLGFAPFSDTKKVSLGISVNWGGVYPGTVCGTAFGTLDTSDTSNGDNRPIPVAASPQITPTGELLYIAGDGTLRQWVADPLMPATSGSRYPTNYVDNDPLVPTPGCSRVHEFLIRPTGEVAYVCAPVPAYSAINPTTRLRSWIQGGVPLPMLNPDETFAALGPGLSGLVVKIVGGFASYSTIDASGVAHDLSPMSTLTTLGGGLHRPSRWVDNRWLLALYYLGQFVPTHLISVTPDGTIAEVGTYPLPSPGISIAGGVMDRRGVMYLRGTYAEGTNLYGTLVRLPPGGTITNTMPQMVPPVAVWGTNPVLELRTADAFIFSGP